MGVTWRPRRDARTRTRAWSRCEWRTRKQLVVASPSCATRRAAWRWTIARAFLAALRPERRRLSGAP